MPTQLEIINKRKDDAELEIREKAKLVDYNTLSYPIEVIVHKYVEGIADNIYNSRVMILEGVIN